VSNYKKKLIEVALPLDAINCACIDDKNRKTGHIRNIHKWFAPMPLPAWRAILFSSLVDDPGNSLPEQEAVESGKDYFRLSKKCSPSMPFMTRRPLQPRIRRFGGVWEVPYRQSLIHFVAEAPPF
jgi:adenine-specific DNA methylase